MVGHEAIRENMHLVFLGVVLQPSQIGVAIVIGKEHLLATIAPLGDVMGHAGADGSGETGHAQNLTRRTARNKG